MLVLLVFVVFQSADALELETNLIPGRIVEGTEGILQVFVVEKDIMFPSIIEDLIITSSDSSILEISNFETTENGFIKNFKINAITSGTTKIGIAAPGFFSREIPIQIYDSVQNEKKFSIKVIPDTFSEDGPKNGYFSVVLLDSNGNPVRAKHDLTMTISSSDSEIVSSLYEEMTIPKGEYHSYGSFNVKNVGNAKLFFNIPNMGSQSSEIIVNEKDDLHVELYAFPTKLNTNVSAQAFIVGQLQTEDGKPVLAEHDITVHYRVTNSHFAEVVNTSDTYAGIVSTGFFIIEKDRYWGYIEFNTLEGLSDIFDVTISSDSPLSLDQEIIETMNFKLYDDKLIKFEPFPILSTGNEELIGVVYLEDLDETPVIASNDVLVTINSSDDEKMTIQNLFIKKGKSSALVFAQTSTEIPTDLELYVQTDISEIITLDIFTLEREVIELHVEPLVDTILAGSKFPLAIYLSENDELVEFNSDSQLFISPSEYFSIPNEYIKKGDSVKILSLESLKKGEDELYVQTDNFVATKTLKSDSFRAGSLILDGPTSIFTGVESLFSIQILDMDDNPLFVEKDTEVNLIIKDKMLIEMPSSVIIKEGQYYETFTVNPLLKGQTEITISSNDLPLSRFLIETEKLEPNIVITGPSEIEENLSFILNLKVDYNGIPLDNVKTQWNVEGALVQAVDETTNKHGESTIALFADSKDQIRISVDVTDDIFFKKTISNNVKVNSSNSSSLEETEPVFEKFTINGIDPLLIFIPSMIGITGFVMKKKNMLKLKNH